MAVTDHLTPLRSQVLVAIDPQAGTVGSFIVPDVASKAPQSTGRVLSHGPLAGPYSPGQRVIFRTTTPMKLGLEEDSGLPVGLLDASEILALLPDDAADRAC